MTSRPPSTAINPPPGKPPLRRLASSRGPAKLAGFPDHARPVAALCPAGLALNPAVKAGRP